MAIRAFFALLAAFGVLAGPVAVAQQKPRTVTDLLTSLPHVGKNAQSYGRLDPGFRLAEYCDESSAGSKDSEQKLSAPLRVIERNIPVENRELFQDRNLTTADLQANFKLLISPYYTVDRADPSKIRLQYAPSVALIGRTPNSLTFWWVADEVTQQQVEAAAGQFCANRGEFVAQHVGSAAQCGPRTVVARSALAEVGGFLSQATGAVQSVRKGLGGMFNRVTSRETTSEGEEEMVNVTKTYVISQFRCTPSGG